jgi:hypothetical protein
MEAAAGLHFGCVGVPASFETRPADAPQDDVGL